MTRSSACLTNPAIPAARKRAVVPSIELLSRASLQPTVGKLLLMLAERDRLVILPEVAGVRRPTDGTSEGRAGQNRHRRRASPDRVTALAAGLTRATGRDVAAKRAVDPAIIGGAVARIGSTVYDGSVTRQLERLRETLAGATD